MVATGLGGHRDDPWERAGWITLEALRLHLDGAGARTVMDLVHTHSADLAPADRVRWVRRLQELLVEMPRYEQALSRIAIYVITCP